MCIKPSRINFSSSGSAIACCSSSFKAVAEEIRKSFRKGAFGNPAFIETYALTEDFGQDEPCQDDAPCNIDSLVKDVCKEFWVTVNELCSSEKRRELVQARGVLARAAQIKVKIKILAMNFPFKKMESWA